MPTPAYTPQLQSEYQRLFDTSVIRADKYPEVNSIVAKILVAQTRYEAIGNKLHIPWYFIAIVHQLEANGRFTSHLHNGDPLTARTIQVPKGRPKTGSPTFSWEFSAEDALIYEKINIWTDWAVPGILYKLETYNGFGYRYLNTPINTPYLWSYSNQYTKGKFVKDSVYSPTAVSKQCGTAVLLRRLVEKQVITLPSGVTNRKNLILQLGTVVTYAPNRYVAKAEELQKMLNLNGAHLKEDGKAGENTSDAYKIVSGNWLTGDPRN